MTDTDMTDSTMATADSAASTAAPRTAADSSPQQSPGFLAKVWRGVSAAFGALMGLVPHVLHHVGLLAGAALVTGVAGNVVFGIVGLLFSIPLLRRLYRRFGTWKAPAIALAIFAVMFSLSAFVIGPAISGGTSAPVQTPSQTMPGGHAGHHG